MDKKTQTLEMQRDEEIWNAGSFSDGNRFHYGVPK